MATQLTREGHLTALQSRVVDAAASARVLVTAGPGTGKTYVLIRRLARLVTDEGLNPAQEILALSFARNAVKNIRDRVMALAPDVRYVRVSTFDSFASRLLRSEDPEGAWVASGYDDRIRAATDLISRGGAIEELADIRQVVIDEVQDLVGVRRVLVETLLEHTHAPFSIFGDPAQGIYNFQLPPGPERDEGSAIFYRWLRKRYAGVLDEVELDINFRAKTKESRLGLWAGAELGRSPDCPAIWERFLVDIGRLPTLGSIEVAAHSLARSRKSTALLCRDNGQALIASRELHRKSVPHNLQRSASDRAVAGWVARSLWGAVGTTLSRAAFDANWNRLHLEGSADEAWRALKRTERKPGDRQLDLRSLNRAIVGRVVDDAALVYQSDSNLTVSSIHRAKGLEFHTVGLVQPQERFDDDLTRCEEARLLYVAMTRPSHVMMHLACPDTKGMSSRRNPDDRWVRRRSFGNGAYMTLNVEVRGTDIDSSVPFIQASGLPKLAAEQMLGLCDQVKQADPVELWLDDASSPSVVRYILMHDVGPLGVTSASFASSLQRTIAISRTRGVPRKIEDLWIEFADTVAGDPSITRAAGIGESGLWLRVRASGLGHLIWK